MIDVGFAGRAVPRCCRGGDSRALLRVDVPVVQVHLGVQLWTKLLTCPSLCNDRVFHSGGATDTVHRLFMWTFSCATNGYDVSSNFACGSDDGLFDAFCVIFRAPPAMPELSASFSSLLALTPVSARGLQGCRSRREFTPR